MASMKKWYSYVLTLTIVALGAASTQAEDGYKSIFNGKDLTGWKGDPELWTVKDGAITATTTPDKKLTFNTFLVYQDSEVKDFELKLKYRIVNGNSGIQYRSKVLDDKKFIVGGYQADFEAGKKYSGILYEEKGRGILALRGQQVVIDQAGKKKVVGSTGDSNKIQEAIKSEQWNDYTIIAHGPYLKHIINGHTTIEIVDQQTGKRAASGALALQVHVGPPMTVQFKDIKIKTLTGAPPAEAINALLKAKPQSNDKANAKSDAKPVTAGTTPNWIWADTATDNQTLHLRKTFKLDWQSDATTPSSAKITATCDNGMTLSVNGKAVLKSSEWETAVTRDISKFLKKGDNVISVVATNAGGVAGFVAAAEIAVPGQSKKINLVTDESWEISNNGKSGWGKPKLIGKLGVAPWNKVFANAVPGNANNPNPANIPGELKLPDGFKAELIYTVPKEQQGSWVSITFDDKGRMIACDQYGGLYRVTLPEIGGNPEDVKIEPLNIQIGHSQGMVYAFGALYITVNGGGIGGHGSGLYRIKDTNGDDQFDEIKTLKKIPGGGEHGPHAVLVAPDKKNLLVVCGNHTDVPGDVNNWRIAGKPQEDLLHPRQWDARGHARGRLAPGGWIAKVDPNGENWEIYSSGFRNQYDAAVNKFGDIFTFDADMEWDMGTPWYRPTRVNHVTSGSEFGWRSGTGKWPEYFPDSLPATIDIGPGSPTGVTFGYGAHFPRKYQEALYILDWTFGTIYAIHLKPEGSSYTATKEEFVTATPLPVTDAEVGPDGAFYFTIGGRRAQSALYRVTYTRQIDELPAAENLEAAKLRSIRQKLESFHNKQDPTAVETAWQYLSHEDRFIRYAARVAIEHQPLESWQSKALQESNPVAAIQAAVALARQGKKDIQNDIFKSLDRIDFGKLPTYHKLAMLRAYALTFIRMGAPNAAWEKSIGDKLDAHYPANDDNVNRELSRVLTYLQHPNVIAKTLQLMAESKALPKPDIDELLARNPRYGGSIAQMLANTPNIQQIHYAFVLRNLRNGWTIDQRKEYYNWFKEASKAKGGASYGGFLNNIRKEAIENTSNAELAVLKDAIGQDLRTSVPKISDLPQAKGPGVPGLTIDKAVELTKDLKGQDFQNGRKMYFATLCIMCHRFNGEGGDVGPDLTGVANRFSKRDLLESILEPSKTISDQYESNIITLNDNSQVVGRIVYSDKNIYKVSANPFDPEALVEVKRADVKKVEPSSVSLMPPGLITPLNEQELKDLMAYLLSRGNAKDPMFKK